MRFHVKHARCPACGWFGFKARRRNANADAAAHIAWAANLVKGRPIRLSDL